MSLDDQNRPSHISPLCRSQRRLVEQIVTSTETFIEIRGGSIRNFYIQAAVKDRQRKKILSPAHQRQAVTLLVT